MLVLPAAPAAEPPASAPAAVAPAAVSDRDLDRLVTDLNNPRYEVRDRATSRLATAGLDVFARLVERYRSESVHERKLRMQYIIEHLYYRKLMAGEEGFIGIRLFAMADVYDPGLGRRCECVYIQEVLKGLPAEQAGLRNGDIMVGFDGRPVAWFFAAQAAEPVARQGPEALGRGVWQPAQAPVDIKVERFTQHVKRRTPGSLVQVRVLRCETQRRQVTLPLPDEPATALTGATLVAVPGAMLGQSPMTAGPAQGGLLATQVAPGPMAQAGIEPRDIIIAVTVPDGIVPPPAQIPGQARGDTRLLVPSEGGLRWLEDVLKAMPPNGSVMLEVVRLAELELPVTLGRRPVQLMNTADLIQARAQFVAWWREEIGGDAIVPATTTGGFQRTTVGGGVILFPEPQVAP